jgi:CspA family cold shock protein
LRAIEQSVLQTFIKLGDNAPYLEKHGASAYLSASTLAGQLGRSAPSITGSTFQPLSNSTNREPSHDRCGGAHVHADSEQDHPMTPGTVKFYNDQKGFGFIAPDDGQKDVFVHATALERAGLQGLREGQKVKFDTQNDPRSGKVAVNAIELA